jgi:hypothetical protein
MDRIAFEEDKKNAEKRQQINKEQKTNGRA